MTVLAVAAVGLLVGCAWGVAAWSISNGQAPVRTLAGRLDTYLDDDERRGVGIEVPAASLEEHEFRAPLVERLFRPITTPIRDFLTRGGQQAWLSRTRIQLDQAGMAMSAEAFIGVQIVAAATGLVVGLVGAIAVPFPANAAITIALPLVGWLGPTLLVNQKSRSRADAIRAPLPGVLDLLTVSLEAGLSLDSAIANVAAFEDGLIADEFRQVVREVRLGRTRAEALRGLADRTRLDELSNFVDAVVQSDGLGTSLASVMRLQAEELRRVRRQRAEETSQKAPIKMLVPMVGCIFPAMFVVLLGPALITVVLGSSAR